LEIHPFCPLCRREIKKAATNIKIETNNVNSSKSQFIENVIVNENVSNNNLNYRNPHDWNVFTVRDIFSKDPFFKRENKNIFNNEIFRNDPFFESAMKRMKNDPFFNRSNGENPFKNDPFFNENNKKDPFKNDPFFNSSNRNDPFKNDPFFNRSNIDDPFKSDPFFNRSNNGDTFNDRFFK
jgi:hypothetical protein